MRMRYRDARVRRVEYVARAQRGSAGSWRAAGTVRVYRAWEDAVPEGCAPRSLA